eukprot:417770-Rhodomonas_salina.1
MKRQFIPVKTCPHETASQLQRNTFQSWGRDLQIKDDQINDEMSLDSYAKVKLSRDHDVRFGMLAFSRYAAGRIETGKDTWKR